MVWGYNFFSFPLLITSLVSAFLALYAWRRRSVPGGTAFFILMTAVAEWALGYTLELASPSLQNKLFWAQVEYFGIVAIPVAWLIFTLQYTGQRQALSRRTLIMLSVIPAQTVLLVWTNGLHGLIWRSVELDTSGIAPVLHLQYGFGFWIHTFYSYLLVSAGMVGLFSFLLRAQRLYRRQIRLVLLAFLIAWIVNAAYIFKLNPVPNLDLTPFAFTITIVLAGLGFLRTQFLDLVPLARGAILESMRDAVIILDAWNRISDYNPAAEAIIRRELASGVGRPASQFFAEFPEWVQRFEGTLEAQEVLVGGDPAEPRFVHLGISPLYDRLGRFTGRLVVLQDITEQEQAKLDLQEANAELEDRVNERTMALQERIDMERLVSNISTNFINRRVDEIEGEINRTLQIIGEFAGVDRCYIFRISPDGEALSNTHEWRAAGVHSVMEQLQNIPCDSLPWWMGRLNSRETIYLPREATLPQAVRQENEILRTKEVHSLVAVPLTCGKYLTGFLGFDSDQKGKVWAEEDRILLGLVGEILASAFARKDAEEALRAREAELRGLFAAMSDQVLVCDRWGKILEAPPTQPSSQYLQTREAVGKTLHDLLSPATAKMILRSIEKALDNHRTVQVDYPVVVDGEQAWFSGAISPVQGERVILVSRDITERKASEDRLIYKALHDVLTGLPNRRMFIDRLERAFERIKRHPKRKAAVLYMDLDGFKAINDSLGHPAGDEFLMATARRLRSSMRASDTVARLGGDEFAILLEDIQGIEEVCQIAGRIQDEISAPVLIQGQSASASASIGIAPVLLSYLRPEEILRDADTAMYQVKSSGKGSFIVYSGEVQEQDLDAKKIKQDLQRAIEQGEFQLFYQPVIDLRSGETTSVEALIRWRHPERGLLLPCEFLGQAEDLQMIEPIEEWALWTACAQVKSWQEAGFQDLRVTVNTSSEQIQGEKLLEIVPEVLAGTALEPHYLELDLSAEIAGRVNDSALQTLEALNRLGVNLAIDNYGNDGRTPIELERVPNQAVKLDPWITRTGYDDLEKNAWRSAAITQAHDLARKVVAKGVETVEQMACAIEQGVDLAQGFLISQALPASCMTEFLHQRSGIPVEGLGNKDSEVTA